MSPRTPYPRSNADCVRLLRTLEFEKRQGIGRGKHPEKYFHNTRDNIVEGDQPFVILPHEFFDQLGMKLMKKLQNWGYSKGEIEAALHGIKPSKEQANVDFDIDIEPGEAA
jgi:hypothetical protein